jgi:hypothetical protein
VASLGGALPSATGKDILVIRSFDVTPQEE